MVNYPFKISYCMECSPPRVIGAGPAAVIKHRVPKGALHTKIKHLEVEEEWQPGERADALLARMQGKYKKKLK